MHGHLNITIKSESYPYTGLGRPLGLQEVEDRRISRQSEHEGSKVVSPTHWLPLPTRRYPWYSSLLEAESTPGPQWGRDRTRDLPACSAVPKPTVSLRTPQNEYFALFYRISNNTGTYEV